MIISESPKLSKRAGGSLGGSSDYVSNLGQALEGNKATKLGEIISRVYSLLIVIGALAVFIYFVWGAFEWLTAGGESDKIAKAQKKITGAIIGFVILLAAWALWRFVLEISGLQTTFILK